MWAQFYSTFFQSSGDPLQALLTERLAIGNNPIFAGKPDPKYRYFELILLVVFQACGGPLTDWQTGPRPWATMGNNGSTRLTTHF